MNSENSIVPRPSDTYWALVPPDELGAQIRGRYIEWLKELQTRGLIDAWNRMASQFYGYDPATGALSDWITTAGEQGQFMALHVNELAALIRHQLILMTAEPVEYDCSPTSDSAQSEAQASLGDQVLKYYQGEGKIDAVLVQGALRMLCFGGGYAVQLWDAFKGPEVGVEEVQTYDASGDPVTEKLEVEVPEEATTFDAASTSYEMQGEAIRMRTETVERPVTEQRIVRGGDFSHRVYSPVDVARDIGARTHDDCSWFIVRERWDRYELAARYPEARQAILEAPAYDRDEFAMYERGRRMASTGLTRSDQIHALRLIHLRGEVVPQGIECLVVGDKVIQPPLPLAYKRNPVHAMVASEMLDTPIGHTSNVDLMGPQSALNAASINGLTAMDAGSRPVWAISRGSNVDVSDMSRGIITYTPNPQAPNGGKPELLEQPELRETHVRGMELWTQRMQSLSGINAVVRGESEGKSGADNALLQAQAVQYQNANVRAYVECARSVGLGIIEGLQTFATHERMVRIVGDDEAPSLVYFSGKDLSDIRHVDVQMGDPAMRQFGMRKQVASELLERFPQQISAEQYLAFMSSGRLEPLYKSQRNEIRLIRSENAALAKGQPVVVMISDCHLDHIREHLALLSSPTLRSDEQLAGIVLAHVQEHEMQWQAVSMRPALLAARGQQPAPPPAGMMPGMAGPAANGPPDAGAPPQEGPAPRADVPGGPEEVAGVQLPQMPRNAANGEPAAPAGAVA